MGDHFEHVGYRYRPPEKASPAFPREWEYAPLEASDDMEFKAARGWQVERLYRRCEDG